MSIPVKLFRSTDPNAPTLNGTTGSLIAVLDACLVDGYNLKAIQSITRVGQVATVTFALAHGLPVDGLTVVRHAGIDQAEFNGDFRISNVTTYSYDITVTGTPATPATGAAMTSKVAPVDWVKAFSGANKGVYRSNAIDATRLLMRVDDNNPNNDANRSAMIVGYESMIDIDTGSSPFPAVAQMTNGVFFNKSGVSDSTPRKWFLIADDRELLIYFGPNLAFPNSFRAFHFGDPSSELASDPMGCLIYGSTLLAYDSTSGEQQCSTVGISYNSVQDGHYFARSYTQLGGPVKAGKIGSSIVYGGNNSYIGIRNAMTYPASGNNQLYASPIYLCENNINQPIRAQLKCIYEPLHVKPLGHGNIISNLSALPGRTLMAISNSANSDSSVGETFVDITGPWR